jgi:hypothetical protein
MRSLTLRRAAVAAAVPLALGSLAGCGDSSSTQAGTDPQSGSGSSAGSTPTQKSTHQAAKDVDPAAFVAELKKSATALTTARFTMTMDVSGQVVTARGALDLTGDKPAMRLTMDLTGMGVPTDMRMLDGYLYVQDPTSGTGKYLKLDLSDPNGPLGDMGGALDNLDPGSMIQRISPDVFRKVTDLGPQTLHGQRVEHYRVVADTQAAAGKLLQNLPNTASLPKTMSYDVWLDGQHRMARFTVLLKKVSKVTATYQDYGADVNITAPPASQIETAPSVNG